MTHKVLKPFKIYNEKTEEYVIFEESDSFDSKDSKMKANVRSLEDSNFIIAKNAPKKVSEDKVDTAPVAISEEISKIEEKPKGRGRGRARAKAK